MEKHTAIWLTFAIIILIVVGTLFYIYAKNRVYEPFTIDADTNCENYYKSCICVGLLITMESYPPQYECKGWEICKDIDRTQCK